MDVPTLSSNSNASNSRPGPLAQSNAGGALQRVVQQRFATPVSVTSRHAGASRGDQQENGVLTRYVVQKLQGCRQTLNAAVDDLIKGNRVDAKLEYQQLGEALQLHNMVQEWTTSGVEGTKTRITDLIARLRCLSEEGRKGQDTALEASFYLTVVLQMCAQREQRLTWTQRHEIHQLAKDLGVDGDITIQLKAGENTVEGDLLLLLSSSKVFRRMFGCGMCESQGKWHSTTIVIDCSVEECKQFLYWLDQADRVAESERDKSLSGQLFKMLDDWYFSGKERSADAIYMRYARNRALKRYAPAFKELCALEKQPGFLFCLHRLADQYDARDLQMLLSVSADRIHPLQQLCLAVKTEHEALQTLYESNLSALGLTFEKLEGGQRRLVISAPALRQRLHPVKQQSLFHQLMSCDDSALGLLLDQVSELEVACCSETDPSVEELSATYKHLSDGLLKHFTGLKKLVLCWDFPIRDGSTTVSIDQALDLSNVVHKIEELELRPSTLTSEFLQAIPGDLPCRVVLTPTTFAYDGRCPLPKDVVIQAQSFVPLSDRALEKLEFHWENLTFTHLSVDSYFVNRAPPSGNERWRVSDQAWRRFCDTKAGQRLLARVTNLSICSCNGRYDDRILSGILKRCPKLEEANLTRRRTSLDSIGDVLIEFCPGLKKLEWWFSPESDEQWDLSSVSYLQDLARRSDYLKTLAIGLNGEAEEYTDTWSALEAITLPDQCSLVLNEWNRFGSVAYPSNPNQYVFVQPYAKCSLSAFDPWEADLIDRVARQPLVLQHQESSDEDPFDDVLYT